MSFDEDYDGGEASPAGEARRAHERVVLGAALQSARAAEGIALILQPEHFAAGAHQTVFAAVMRLADDGEPVDPVAVLGELARTGMLRKVGDRDAGTGGPFLHALVASAVAGAKTLEAGLDGGTAWHAWKVREAHQRDEVTVALHRGLQVAQSPGFEPGTGLDEIRKLVDDATSVAGPSALRGQAEMINEAIGRLEEGSEPGLPTGLTDLDAVLGGGMKPGNMIIVGGRPGDGKSVLTLNVADHVSGRMGMPVLLCSLEMSAEEVAHRRIAAAAKVPLHAIVSRDLSDGDWDRIKAAYAKLTASELRIDDTPGMSLAQVRGRLSEMAREGNPARLAVIDYLGLLAEPKAESRQQAVSALARGCKNLAREFGIPVLVAAQLNRGPAHRQDKLPTLADLRESGEIEAAADVVILLHREDAYEPESPKAGEADLCVRKNRQGPQSTVTVQFQGHYARMVGLAWTPLGKQAAA